MITDDITDIYQLYEILSEAGDMDRVEIEIGLYYNDPLQFQIGKTSPGTYELGIIAYDGEMALIDWKGLEIVGYDELPFIEREMGREADQLEQDASDYYNEQRADAHRKYGE